MQNKCSFRLTQVGSLIEYLQLVLLVILVFLTQQILNQSQFQQAVCTVSSDGVSRPIIVSLGLEGFGSRLSLEGYTGFGHKPIAIRL